ncbi:MAG: hypothetical protein U1F41_09195 [Burkholderiales bacterium]
MRFSLAFTHALPAGDIDRIPALARLASFGTREDAGDADAAVAALLGVTGHAIAPLAARGAGLDPADAYVLRADPVTFVAGRDDVLLAGRVDDLGEEHAASLVATLGRHFAQDGIAFHAPRADAWFALASAHVPVEADPPLTDQPIGARLPRGPHGATWRRWLSEMQMLLHEHPVNQAREAAGLPPATGIWISGGGRLPRSLALAPIAIHAAPSRLGDVAIGIARIAGAPVEAPPARFDAQTLGGDTLVVMPSVVDLGSLERDWLAPAVAALERGAISHLTVVSAGERTLRHASSRPSWWRRLRTPT